jgi:hypothetical protein
MIDASSARSGARVAEAAVTARVSLVTCAELPDLDPDDQLVLEPLAALGVAVDAAIWDDAGVDWASYDLVVLRSTWDYAGRRDEFVSWASRVPRLANPADVVAWSTDKRYLGELASAGVPVVPTRWVGPADVWTLPVEGEWVIKPAVGAGSRDTGRYDATNASHRELAVSHVARLQAASRLVMVQPYLRAVDSYGETALLFVGGEYSHAIRKGPMLQGPDVGVEGLYKQEEITSREPSATELAIAEKALAAVPGGSHRLLYARADLIPGVDGEPLLVELELAEPSLFMATAGGAARRLARAILATV